jgi:antitoxin (DNA-binding transcriptional repressor) of toxin-antitoxin stability system
MPTVSIQAAQAKLSDLIHQLAPGDELVITENNEPVAKLARTEPKIQPDRQAGGGSPACRLVRPGTACST